MSHHPNKIANLVMLGTPNTGTEAARVDLTDCSVGSGLFDLLPGSEVTNTKDSKGTKYWVLAGNLSSPCYFVIARSICGLEESDGLVTKDSALSHYQSLGVFPLNHTGLLTSKNVYNNVLPLLRGSK